MMYIYMISRDNLGNLPDIDIVTITKVASPAASRGVHAGSPSNRPCTTSQPPGAGFGPLSVCNFWTLVLLFMITSFHTLHSVSSTPTRRVFHPKTGPLRHVVRRVARRAAAPLKPVRSSSLPRHASLPSARHPPVNEDRRGIQVNALALNPSVEATGLGSATQIAETRRCLTRGKQLVPAQDCCCPASTRRVSWQTSRTTCLPGSVEVESRGVAAAGSMQVRRSGALSSEQAERIDVSRRRVTRSAPGGQGIKDSNTAQPQVSRFMHGARRRPGGTRRRTSARPVP